MQLNTNYPSVVPHKDDSYYDVNCMFTWDTVMPTMGGKRQKLNIVDYCERTTFSKFTQANYQMVMQSATVWKYTGLTTDHMDRNNYV